MGGGYAVAPPSVATKGQYEIIHGTLDDLNNLPPLHVMLDQLRRPIVTGKRNTSVFRVGLEQALHSDDFESLLDVMRTRNMDCEIPSLILRLRRLLGPPGDMSGKAATSSDAAVRLSFRTASSTV